MSESEVPQDAPYSDEEFSSDHEGGYEDFADEDAVVGTTQDAVHEGSPMDDKCDEEVDEEDAERYDGEFDEDEPTVVDIDLPKVGNDVTMREQILTTAAVEPQVDTLDVGGSPGANAATEGQSNASDDSEAEYSNDMENDIPVAPSNNADFPSAPSEESVTKRRSSVPVSVTSGLSDDSPPKAGFVRAGSMPMIMLDRPVDKWMDTLPQELSPERTDRFRRQSALPVLDEVHNQNSVVEEDNTDEDESCADDNNDSYSVSSISNSRARAHSYMDLQCKKTVVPIRRAQSLLYTGSLPRVVEVILGEDIEAGSDHDNEDLYSDEDDEDNYDDGSQTSFQGENENDATQPVSGDRPKSGISSILDKASAPTDASTQGGPLSRNEGETSILSGDPNSSSLAPLTPTSAASSDEQDLPKERDTPLPPQKNIEDDDYADEMENEFPSDSNTPHFEGDMPPKSSGEASDFDVDEFIEDGRRETETLLQEVRTLLQQQQQHESEPPVQQIIASPDMSTTTGSSAAVSENLVGGDKESDGIGDEKYSTPYDDEEFVDVDGEATNQDASEKDVVGDHGGMGNYEFDTDDYEEHDAEAFVYDEPNAPTQLVDPDNTVDINLPPSTIAVDRIQSCSEAACTSDSPVEAENEVSLSMPSENPISDGIVLEAVETQSVPVQPPQPEASYPTELSSAAGAGKRITAITNESPKSNRSEKAQVASQPARSKQPATTSPKQTAPTIKPSRPPGNRQVPVASVLPLHSQPTTPPGSARDKVRTFTSECKTPNPNPAVCNTTETTGGSSSEATVESSPTRKQGSPSKYRNGISSPQSPSKTCSRPYEYLPNEYPQLPRKEAVFKQKVSSKPSTRGETKRRLLQPVRTPANLRFDLPKMDKTKRDWLFVNMFRYGDDLSKFEAFVPPTLLARPPATKETKKRPLSARQVYGNSHTSGFVSSGRKLVQQTNPQMQDRERKWVATTPHDSKLPPYDSILDKYCTTVTSPVVQRQIYETRHRDLSPQLAFVLEKRVEKHCRKGFHDPFGGVSSSYKTEIVPISPGDDTRPRQISTRSHTKPGLLEKPVARLTAADEE